MTKHRQNRRAMLGLACSMFWLAGQGGCSSPENGRARGGGPGADGGNYLPGAVRPPSKLDGTRTWNDRPSP